MSSGPEGTSKLHDEVAQMPTVLTPDKLPSLSQHASMASWRVRYDQLTEEEKIQGLICRWFCMTSVQSEGGTAP